TRSITGAISFSMRWVKAAASSRRPAFLQVQLSRRILAGLESRTAILVVLRTLCNDTLKRCLPVSLLSTIALRGQAEAIAPFIRLAIRTPENYLRWHTHGHPVLAPSILDLERARLTATPRPSGKTDGCFGALWHESLNLLVPHLEAGVVHH